MKQALEWLTPVSRVKMKTVCLLCLVTVCAGLSNRKVYLEAEENCGQTHILDSGEVIVMGSKRVPTADLREQCEITFTSASADDQDRVCMEIEELSFQGNRFASLSVYDVLMTGGYRVKKLGVYDNARPPPVEVCSTGRSLRMNLNRGFISFQRHLVLFLLQVYTKNPDAPLEDRVKEVPGMFHHVDTYIIILIVIASVVVLVLITMVTVVIFCVRQRSARSSQRGDNSPRPALASTQSACTVQPTAPRQEVKSGQEYFPLRPLPPRHYISQQYAPYVYQAYRDQAYRDQAYRDPCWGRDDDGYPSSAVSASLTGTHSTPVSSYYQTYALHDHTQACQCYSYPADSLQGDGYASERYSGENYDRFSGEGYHSDGYLTERCPTQTYTMERLPPHGVLRGYTGYPGITHPLLPGQCYGANMGYRQGEEDADQSDVSDSEGQGQGRIRGQVVGPCQELGQGQELGQCKGDEQGQDDIDKVKSRNEADLEDGDYQEVGPSQFRHVTFM